MSLKCHFNDHCVIDVYTRRTCSYCRWMKCLQSGMLKEMIRSPRPKLIPRLNLVQSDLSTLTNTQWNLISNLSHCYDEYAGLSMGETYLREQHNLPFKYRFKSSSIINLCRLSLQGAELLYQKNEDFLSLSSIDRSHVLENTFKYTACLGANFIISKVGIASYPAYYDSMAMVIHPNVIPATQRIAHRFDFDMIMMKLLLGILSFSTIHLTMDSKTSSWNLLNVKEIVRIQNIYIDIAWRYLVYKEGFHGAVKCFSELIRCIFAVNEILVETYEVQWIANTLDSLVQETKENLSIQD